MLCNLSTEESFKDVSVWELAHACQGHLPVVDETSQLVTDHVDCEQILKVEHLAINFAYLVMLIEQQQDLPSFQKQSLGGAFFHQDVDLPSKLTSHNLGERRGKLRIQGVERCAVVQMCQVCTWLLNLRDPLESLVGITRSSSHFVAECNLP
jgi:hypothetical protein